MVRRGNGAHVLDQVQRAEQLDRTQFVAKGKARFLVWSACDHELKTVKWLETRHHHGKD